MAHANRVPFGQLGGRLVEVADVPQGANCGCVCPSCGNPLTARKGSQVTHHFSHRSTVDRQACDSPAETALHLMAKQLVHDATTFKVPAWVEPEWVHKDGVEEREEAVICRTGTLVVHDRALERATEDGRIRPDVRLIGTLEGTQYERELWIEIAVTHHVSDEKRELLRAEGIRCIEIDLGDFDPFSGRDALKHRLFHDDLGRYWVCHPNEDDARAKARSRGEQRLEERLDRVRAENERRNRQDRIRQAKQERKAKAREARIEKVAASKRAQKGRLAEAKFLAGRMLQPAMEVLMQASSIVLPQYVHRVEIGRPPRIRQELCVVEPGGRRTIEHADMAMDSALPRATAELTVQGARLLVPLLARSLDSGVAESVSLRHGAAVVAIRLDSLAYHSGELRGEPLVHALLNEARGKYWLHHPDKAERVHAFCRTLVPGAAAETEASASSHPGDASPTPDLASSVRAACRGLPEYARRAKLIELGAFRPQGEGPAVPPLSPDDLSHGGWLVCRTCSESRPQGLVLRYLPRLDPVALCPDCGAFARRLSPVAPQNGMAVPVCVPESCSADSSNP